MAFQLPPLPYDPSALAPHLSQETLEFHHGKHHNTYVTKLNDLTGGEKTEADLEAIVLEEEVASKVFNNAAQHWNHSFYWKCMSPDGGGQPSGELADALDSAFGSLDAFKEKLSTESANHFASGWGWLVHDGSKLDVISTHDADLPLKHGLKALLTVDVWEHAYYIDYRNKRPDYLAAFVDHLVNWDFVAQNLREV